MKKFAVALLCVLLALPALAAEQPQWYPDEGVLRVQEKGDIMLSLNVATPEYEVKVFARGQTQGEDIPFYAMVWTMDSAFFPGVTEEVIARERLDGLLAWYPQPQMEQADEGMRLMFPLPVVLKEKAWDNAMLTLDLGGQAGEEQPLQHVQVDAPYVSPVAQPYTGYVTILSSCNIRADASATSERVARAGEKTVLPALGEKDNWYHVLLLDGSKGYVSKNLSRLDSLPGLKEARQQILLNELTGAARGLEMLSSPLAAQSVKDLAGWNQADGLGRQGKYQQAREGYLLLGTFGGAQLKAEELKDIQPFPKTGVLQKDVQGGDCEILFHAPRKDNAYYIKLFSEGADAPQVTLFLLPGERLRVKVPQGSYSLKYATGNVWQGEEKAFGLGGTYARATENITFTAPKLRATVVLSPVEENSNQEHTRLDAEGF